MQRQAMVLTLKERRVMRAEARRLKVEQQVEVVLREKEKPKDKSSVFELRLISVSCAHYWKAEVGKLQIFVQGVQRHQRTRGAFLHR